MSGGILSRWDIVGWDTVMEPGEVSSSYIIRGEVLSGEVLSRKGISVGRTWEEIGGSE